MKELRTVVEKINSIAILFIIVIFVFGTLLLSKSTSFTTPSTIGGFMLLSFGLLYSIFAYSFNQIHENYKSIIKELHEIIKTWKSSAKTFEKTHRDYLTSETEGREISGKWRKKIGEETEEISTI